MRLDAASKRIRETAAKVKCPAWAAATTASARAEAEGRHDVNLCFKHRLGAMTDDPVLQVLQRSIVVPPAAGKT
jgi:hypothetical protein